MKSLNKIIKNQKGFNFLSLLLVSSVLGITLKAWMDTSSSNKRLNEKIASKSDFKLLTGEIKASLMQNCTEGLRGEDVNATGVRIKTMNVSGNYVYKFSPADNHYGLTISNIEIVSDLSSTAPIMSQLKFSATDSENNVFSDTITVFITPDVSDDVLTCYIMGSREQRCAMEEDTTSPPNKKYDNPTAMNECSFVKYALNMGEESCGNLGYTTCENGLLSESTGATQEGGEVRMEY